MSTANTAAILVSHVRSLPDFTIVETIDGSYGHMGATITDGMLQAGLKYDAVVRPRVHRLRQQYPQACTTSGFLSILRSIGPETVVQWTHPEKIGRIVGLATFLQAEKIETEEEFRQWLQEPANVVRLKKLRGIGDKTADYFNILVGGQTSAIDRHLLGFLNEVGIKVNRYDEAQQVIDQAADMLGVERSRFDHSIWKYMSTRKTKPYSE